MIAQVIPRLRLPRQLSVFDYRVPTGTRLHVGSLVVIEFRRRKVVGVVEKLLSKSNIPAARLKPIIRVLSEQPILTNGQHHVLRYVSDEGYAALGTTLRSMTPACILSEAITLPTLSPQSKRISALAPKLVTYRYEATKLKAIQTSLRAVLAHQSVLIITPTRASAEVLARSVPGSILFDHAHTPVAFRQLYLKLRTATSSVVIGTRSAIFAPIQNIGSIIIDDEDSDELIQDEPNPRYDVRALAMILARHSGAQLTFMSRLPTLVSFQNIKDQTALEPITAPERHFTDLEETRRGGDYGIISEHNQHRLSQIISKNQRAVVVHAQSSDFSSLACADCGYLAVCPTCRVSFRVDERQLVCKHCGTSEAIPDRCPKCQSTRLRGRGRGIAHLVQELRRLPGARVSTDPGDTTAHIIVVTPNESRLLTDRHYHDIMISRYDSLLAVPRPDADERARRLLHVLAAKLKDTGKLTVQGSPVYQDIIVASFQTTWRAGQLQAAEQFGYPPAWRLLQLRRRNESTKTGRSAVTVAQELRHLNANVRVTGPMMSRSRSRADRGGQQILLRYRHQAPESIRTYIRTLDESWTVALDPRELR